jgi:phosphodiesterase/alkaline phosphatase D-like protein
MRRKHLWLSSVVILVASAVWTIDTISSLHYRLPKTSLNPAEAAGPVYMVNGIKIGEVTSDSAIIWTRLTRNPSMDPETKWGRVVTGVPGEVRVSYWCRAQKPYRNHGIANNVMPHSL